MSERTPWFDAKAHKPVRKGIYEAQDQSMNCECCTTRLHWDGREWHSDLLTRGFWRTWVPDRDVRRWRGLAEPPK